MSQSWVNCIAFTNELEEEVLLFYFNVISIYPEVYRLCSSFISFFLSFFFIFGFFETGFLCIALAVLEVTL